MKNMMTQLWKKFMSDISRSREIGIKLSIEEVFFFFSFLMVYNDRYSESAFSESDEKRAHKWSMSWFIEL